MGAHEHEHDRELERAVRALEAFAARVRAPQRPRTATLEAAAVQVAEAFRSARVDALVLKGAALDRMLYDDGVHRDYSDVDVLVAPAQLPEARAALRGLGYRNASETLGIDDIGGVVHAETWIGIPAMSRDEVVVELHLWFAGAKAPAEVAWAALLARRTALELASGTVPVLDRDGQALHLATHAAQHGATYARGCTELELALTRWPDDVWRGAARLARDIQATDAFAAGLRLVPSGIALADHLGLPDTPQLDWELRQDPRPRGTFHVAALAEAEGVRGRLVVLRRALLPQPRWVRRQYPWAAEGRARLIAAYAAHVLRAPAWAARAWAFHRRARRARLRPPRTAR